MTTIAARLRRRQAAGINRLALQRRNQGRYAAALALARHALTVAETAFPPDAAQMAAYLNDVGVACKYPGRFAEAEAAYHRALAIARRSGDRNLLATLHH